MNLIYFEIRKIVNKRISLILLIATAILFPVMVGMLSYLTAADAQVPEGLFANYVAFTIISFFQTLPFLPIWMIIFLGQELSNGHVNRVVFAKSRKHYFLLKIAYSCVVTFFFSFIGLLTLVIALNTSLFSQLIVSPTFYVGFFVQLFFATFGYSILLLGLTFIFRSPTISFVIYFGWTIVESIAFVFMKGSYGIEMKWMPFQLIRTFFSRNGVTKAEYYFNPFIENITATIAPISFMLLIILGAYYYFSKVDLKPLSD